MSIKEEKKNEKIFYRPYVCVRSRKDPRIKLQRVGAHFKTKREAERAEKFLLRKTQEEVFSREHERIRWGALVEEWDFALLHDRGTDKPIHTTTAHDYVAALRLYTGDWWQKSAEEVTKHDVKFALNEIRVQGKSVSRQKTLKNALNGIYRWAIEEGKVSRNLLSPAHGIKLSAEREERPPEILNSNQIKKLIAVATETKHPWLPVWAFALLTGMRSGELYALEWSDVDWVNNKLVVSRSHSARTKQIKCTKAGYYRDIPINSDLLKLLNDLKAVRGRELNVLPRLQGWAHGDAARILRAFCEGHGLPSIRFHTLRSCVATQLLKNKVAPAQVMKVAGWKGLKTMQRYVRLAGIEVDGALDSIKILPDRDVLAEVVPLFTGTCGEPNAQRLPNDGDK